MFLVKQGGRPKGAFVYTNARMRERSFRVLKRLDRGLLQMGFFERFFLETLKSDRQKSGRSDRLRIANEEPQADAGPRNRSCVDREQSRGAPCPRTSRDTMRARWQSSFYERGSRNSAEHPDRGAEAFHRVEDRSFWFRHRADCIQDAVGRFPPCGVIADVGGGNGYITRRLLDADHDALLVEPSASATAAASARGISSIIRAKLQEARFDEGAFGGVALCDVLEHQRDDQAFLRELRRVTREGGRLYLTVPSFPGLWSSADEAAGHERRYTFAPLCRLVEDAGYTVERATCFFSFLVLPLGALRVLPWRLGIARPADAESVARDFVAPRIATPALAFAARLERSWIATDRRVPMGTSILLVAKAASTRSEGQ